MLTDGLRLTEGSSLINATVANGTSFPSFADAGELFFRTDLLSLHVHNGTDWIQVGLTSSQLEGHPGSYYLDNTNATGTMSVPHGGTGVTSYSALVTALGLDIGTNVQAYDPDLSAIAGISATSGLLKKTGANAWSLDTNTYLTANQSITVSGDASGTGTTAITLTLGNVGTAGTYKSVTTNAKGLVVSGTNPTTLAGYGITDAQPLDGDLTSIAGLSGSTGLARKTNTNTWVLDTASYLQSTGDTFTGTLTMTGDIIPSANVTYSLGSSSMQWKDIWVGPGSLYINGKEVISDQSNTIVFSTDINQNLRIATSGTGNIELQPASTGVIAVKGTMTVTTGKRILDSAGIQVEFGDDISMNNNKVVGLGTPTASTDAATKAYADSIGTTAANAASLTAGVLADGRVQQSNVTQHQAALTILETQITDGALLARVGGNETITGTWSFNNPVSVGTPSSNSHAATKAYVDSIASGVNPQLAVRVATTANITLGGTQTIDGVAVIAGDRVLAKDQTTGSLNGVYVVAAGAWARAVDFDGSPSNEVITGDLVFISEGTANANTSFVLVTEGTITVGTTAMVFSVFSRAGDLIAGAGLTRTGQSIDVVGTAGRIVANADSIDLATAGTAGTYFQSTTDAYGRVTSGANPTTLAGFGITDAQPLDGDLTSIAGLAGTAGLARKTAANTWSLDTNTYLTANQAITLTGDASGTGTTSIAVTLATVASAGTYRSVTINSKGLVTSGTNPTTLAGYGITDAQPLDSDLTALAALATTGFHVITGSGTAATRSIAVAGTGLSISNGDGVAGNVTITSNATNANTASTIVARDASGNFTAGTITAALTGTASGNLPLGGGALTGLVTQTAGEAFRLMSAGAFISGYNAAASIRTGYLQWNTGSDVRLVAEQTNALILQTTGGSLTIATGGGATFSSTLSATSFTGAGTGLTGSAASLNAGTVTSNAGRTDATAYPVVWNTGATSPNYTCAAVTIQSSTGTLAATIFSGSGSGLTGTAASLTAGNATTVGGFTPSASSGVASRVVVADSSGYINNTYINTSDEGTSGTAGTVTAIITKRGDNYLRSTSAQSVATFLSGTSMNITGNAATATLAANASSISSAVGNAYTWTGVSYFASTGAGAAGIGQGGSNARLMAYNTDASGAGDAFMAFHRPGVYAINMGLASDNVFRLGGWSDGASTYRLQSDTSGNLTIRGGLYPNNGANYLRSNSGSYGSLEMVGLTSGYVGVSFSTSASGTVTGMFDSAGNGGDYDTTTSWHYYWNRANACLAIGGSTTAAGYKSYVNGAEYVAGDIRVIGNMTRSTHSSGFIVGSYNSVAANDSKTNPIYTIGSGYIPTDTALSSMYGIGYTHSNSGFLPSGSSGWGQYVASAGVARIFFGSDGGTILATGDITAYASDRRLKTNIVPISNALDKVMKLRGVEYDWIDGVEDLGFVPSAKHETGVIAQEVQAVIPDAVKTAPFNQTATQKTGVDENYLTVDKEKIIPVLIEAVKELNAKVEMLMAKLAKYEA